MTKFDYARMEATAQRLINKFGQDAIIRRVTVSGGTAYDPTSGTTTTTDYAAIIVVMKYTLNEIDGTLIKAGDKKVYLSTDIQSVPLLSDKLVIGSDVHSIESILPLNPAGTTLLYEIQARH
jgi:hypothetical protein